MSLHQWNFSPCKPLVCFSPASWLLIICFLIVVVDPSFSICWGRPPEGCHGVNVMLGLRGSLLQWQLVPPPPPPPPYSSHWAQHGGSPSGALPGRPIGSLMEAGSMLLSVLPCSCISLSGGLAVPVRGREWLMRPTLFNTLWKPSGRWGSTRARFDAKLHKCRSWSSWLCHGVSVLFCTRSSCHFSSLNIDFVAVETN